MKEKMSAAEKRRRREVCFLKHGDKDDVCFVLGP
jgi:hypothetical protein